MLYCLIETTQSSLQNEMASLPFKAVICTIKHHQCINFHFESYTYKVSGFGGKLTGGGGGGIVQCYTFSFYKLQSRGVARNSYTEVGARVGICDHIAHESSVWEHAPRKLLYFRPLIQSSGISGCLIGSYM